MLFWRQFNLLILPFISTTYAATWVKITRPSIIWENMEVNKAGERIFHCGEFDATYTGRYHWRFNGSSILPERTQIHKNQFVFLSGSNAIRNRLDGEYECCVRETLGNACYSRMIVVNNMTTIHNIDLAGSDEDLIAQEGDTYYIRMLDVKRIEGVKCTLDGVNLDNFKYPFLGKYTKKVVPYHLKIENLENSGEVVCDLRIQKKETFQKIFRVRLASSSSNLLFNFAIFWSIIFSCWVLSNY